MNEYLNEKERENSDLYCEKKERNDKVWTNNRSDRKT